MDARVVVAMNEMQQRLADPLTVTALAAAVRLSPSRFAHLFSAETGVAPMRYLQRMRMDRARLLLERTALSIREVMAQVGYRDASHFARDFRRHHELGPGEWRREVLQRARRTAAAPTQVAPRRGGDVSRRL
jgi:AraC family transcriptional regulator of arabinose operon